MCSQLSRPPDLPCPAIHALSNFSDCNCSFQFFDPPNILGTFDTFKVNTGRNKLNPLRVSLFLLYGSVEPVNEGQEKIGLQVSYGLSGICISLARF
jgi:hypothetical protein